MKNLGHAGLILNTKILKNTDRYVLSQSHYIEKNFEKSYGPNCLSTPLPMILIYIYEKYRSSCTTKGVCTNNRTIRIFDKRHQT